MGILKFQIFKQKIKRVTKFVSEKSSENKRSEFLQVWLRKMFWKKFPALKRFLGKSGKSGKRIFSTNFWIETSYEEPRLVMSQQKINQNFEFIK